MSTGPPLLGLVVDNAPEEIAISGGLGLSVLLLALLVLGLLHLFQGWAFALLLGAPLLLLWRDAAGLWGAIRKGQSGWENTRPPPRR